MSNTRRMDRSRLADSDGSARTQTNRTFLDVSRAIESPWEKKNISIPALNNGITLIHSGTVIVQISLRVVVEGVLKHDQGVEQERDRD